MDLLPQPTEGASVPEVARSGSDFEAEAGGVSEGPTRRSQGRVLAKGPLRSVDVLPLLLDS